MRVSPSIEVQENEMKNMLPGNKLGYIAAIFKGTVGIGMPATQMTGDVVSKQVDPPWPGAVLQIEGPTNYAWDIVKQLETFHGVPQRFIKVISKPATSFNNVGGYWNTRHVTADGLERTFALNHLASFLLTNLLLDLSNAIPKPRRWAPIA